MVEFILNNTHIKTDLKPATTLLDFIRYHQNLMGTKIGCREGDCGACTILTGQIVNNKLEYTSATSCLMPVGNAHKKHIVTIEGLNIDNTLNGVQQSFANEGATQCGFCTPGFIVSLCGYCLSEGPVGYHKAIDAVNGNICRCTGYKSIERAVSVVNALIERREMRDPIEFAVQHNLVPAYFLSIRDRLKKLEISIPEGMKVNKIVGGGTDLYVQQHDTIIEEDIHLVFDTTELNGIIQRGNICVIGAAATVTNISDSEIFRKHFPELQKYIRLVSSTQIRNMATIAGNIINASPIGDFSIFLLALDAKLLLSNGVERRELPLRKLYKGYKVLDKQPDEFIEKIIFNLPGNNDLFNFEKVSKRTHLDIASVNSAIFLQINNDIISDAGISAGGVAAIPAFLGESSAFLKGKKISTNVISELLIIIQREIAPISDARGTAEYKRLLLHQLVKAHFITFFPEFENSLIYA